MQYDTTHIGKFDGVTEQVRNNLLQAHRVAKQRYRHIRLDKAVKAELFTHHQRHIVGADVVHNLTRRKFARLDFQLLRFNFREVENVANDFQQQA
ncbi:hypothetical protein D3C87_1649810 [compost metagenome]